MSTEEDKKAIEYFLKILETQGVAITSVNDGHLIFFKTQWLRDLLEKHPTQEKISIFLKKPDFQN